MDPHRRSRSRSHTPLCAYPPPSRPLSPTVTHEWSHLSFTPSYRSNTPFMPSHTPSPCPSLLSTASTDLDVQTPSSCTTIEIEELPDSYSPDDHELLHGEFEEASEPRIADEDEDEDEEEDEHQRLLYGLQKLRTQTHAHTPSRWSYGSSVASGKKRTFAESVGTNSAGESESDSDYSNDSAGERRVRRRRIVAGKMPEQFGGISARSSQIFAMDMEL